MQFTSPEEVESVVRSLRGWCDVRQSWRGMPLPPSSAGSALSRRLASSPTPEEQLGAVQAAVALASAAASGGGGGAAAAASWEGENPAQAHPRPASTPEPRPPVAAAATRGTLEFKRRPAGAIAGAGTGKSNLTRELEQLKRGGQVVGNAAGPQVMVTVFLPSRKPLELRASKTATIAQIVAAVVERAGAKALGRRGQPKPDEYELRLHDSDGLPDEDFPALEPSQLVVEVGSTEFCLVGGGGMTGDDVMVGEDAAEEDTPGGGSGAGMPAPTLIRGTSLLKMGDARLVKVHLRLFEGGTTTKTTTKSITEDLRISQLLASIIHAKSRPYPLFVDNFQLQVTKADQERLGLLSQYCDPMALVSSFDVSEFELVPRRYLDSAPLVDADALTKEVEMQARRNSESRARNRQSAAAAGGAATGKGALDSTTITPEGTPAKGASSAAVNSPGAGIVRSTSPRAGFNLSSLSASKSKRNQRKNMKEAVDPESILLNEIKAAVYEQWDVVKYNQWNRGQPRVLGVDLQKIYNKQRDSDEKGAGKVQRDERLIADVLSIEMDAANPSAFVIRYRDGPGGSEAVRKYEAVDGPHVAAEIVAKVRYLMSGRV